MGFEAPDFASAVADDKLTPPMVQWMARVNAIANALQESGTTANRPTVNLWIGRQYFDTTINKPIYVSAVRPTVWRDAAGTVV